jgi:hypothetical protein
MARYQIWRKRGAHGLDYFGEVLVAASADEAIGFVRSESPEIDAALTSGEYVLFADRKSSEDTAGDLSYVAVIGHFIGPGENQCATGEAG